MGCICEHYNFIRVYVSVYTIKTFSMQAVKWLGIIFSPSYSIYILYTEFHAVQIEYTIYKSIL
jgi:hypothetical protein